MKCTTQPATSIDMWAPAEAAHHLQVDDGTLVDLVNDGRLAAYRLGSVIRFRRHEVEALADQLVAA